MRGTAMRRIIIVTILLLTAAVSSVSADPLRSWNHDFNPALLGARNRPIIELGFSPEVGVSNSYFSAGDILVEEIVIDFNDMADQIGDGNLTLGAMTSVESHLAVSLLGIRLGGYSNLTGVNSIGIPGNIFKFLADGNNFDGTDSGSGDVYSRIFLESGMYGGYRWKDYEFGMKLGAFVPIMYSDSSASFDYSITTNSTTGEIHANAGLNVPFYSALNFADENGDPDPMDLMDSFNGINASFGAIKMKGKKAMYGVSLTGIALKPAVVPYKMLLSSDASITMDGIAANVDAEDDSWIQDSVTDPDFQTLEEGEYEISTPMQLGGFYRLTGFPGFIDWIGHGQLTFDDELQYNIGVTAVGAFFPINWLSLGVEYDRVLWRTTLGLRANVRVLELGVDVGLTAPEITNMLSTNGIYGKVYFALGF